MIMPTNWTFLLLIVIRGHQFNLDGNVKQLVVHLEIRQLIEIGLHQGRADIELNNWVSHFHYSGEKRALKVRSCLFQTGKLFPWLPFNFRAMSMLNVGYHVLLVVLLLWLSANGEVGPVLEESFQRQSFVLLFFFEKQRTFWPNLGLD
jgi:hypothetical protein